MKRTPWILLVLVLASGPVRASTTDLAPQLQFGPVVFDPATESGIERAIDIPVGLDRVRLESRSSALRLERVDRSRTRIVLGAGVAGPVSGRLAWTEDGVDRVALIAGEIVVAPREDWPALLFRRRDHDARTDHAMRTIGLPPVRSVRTMHGATGIAQPDADGWQRISTPSIAAEATARLVLDEDAGAIAAQFSTLEAVTALSRVGLQQDVEWVRVRTLRKPIGASTSRVLVRGRKNDARLIRAFDFSQDGLQGRFTRLHTTEFRRRNAPATVLGVRIPEPEGFARRGRALILAGERARLIDPRLGVVDRATREGFLFSGAAVRSRVAGRKAFAVRLGARTQDFFLRRWDVLGNTDGTRLVGKRYRPSLSDRLGARIDRVFDATMALDRTGWPQQPLRDRLLVLGRRDALPVVWSVRLDRANERIASVRPRWSGERLGDLGVGRPQLRYVPSPVAGRRGFPAGLRVQLPAVQATRVLERRSPGGRYSPVRQVQTFSTAAAVDGFALRRPRFVQLDRNANQEAVLVRWAVTANGRELITGRRIPGESTPIDLRISSRIRTAFALTGPPGSRFLRAFDLDLGTANVPPRIDAGADIVVRPTNQFGARIALRARLRDTNGDPLALRWAAPGVRFDDPTSPQTEALFPIGTTDVLVRVREARGNGVAKASGTFEAVDALRVTVDGVTDAPVVGPRTAIAGAFPNPFNPRTRIAFSLARGGSVELAVYDARGRRVRTLLDESRTAGPWDVVWDGLDDDGLAVASGVYRVQLKTAESTDTIPIALVR